MGGNLFKSLTKNSKKNIKFIFLLYVFFKKKNFKLFLTINSIISKKFISNKIINLFLFTFYFSKTKNILIIPNSNIFSKFLNTGVFKNFFQHNYHKTLTKYIKLSVLDCFSGVIYLQKTKDQLELKLGDPIHYTKSTTSSIYKNISLFDINNVELQFLRKNKVYNKGRYSRCRQNYRTGVYLCMYLSIVSIFGLYYWFFKFSFNFSYLW
jgi:hypothetical protein